jgi:hypothetical protein
MCLTRDPLNLRPGFQQGFPRTLAFWLQTRCLQLVRLALSSRGCPDFCDEAFLKTQELLLFPIHSESILKENSGIGPDCKMRYAPSNYLSKFNMVGL